jgi:glycosyltransferase involved in cell wall biosynthesis
MEKEKYHFAYVMDQQVGLKTHALNIARVSESQKDIQTTFVPVCYAEETAPLSRLPILPESVRSVIRGTSEIRSGLGESNHYDAVLWATWAAKSALDCVERWPAYWMMDMTPDQMRDMGEHYGYSNRRANFMQSFKRRATDRLYSNVRHFFPWSTFVADSLVSDYGISADKITVTSPGTNTTLFAPPTEKKSDGPVRILFVGGDFERKGGDLLKAWAENKKNVELHIVTRDDIAPTPNLHIHKNITNNSPELIALYQQADIFVLPTRADCYSLVSMEAMSCGVPVVISNIGGISDIVTDTETGFLMPPGDGNAMGKHLDLLVSDNNLRHSMGQKSREKALEKFDSTKNIESLLQKMREGC